MIKLWEHQQQALDLCKKQNSFALFMEPGTGKTLVAIEWLKTIGSGLVIVPVSLCRQWESEIVRFWPSQNSISIARKGSDVAKTLESKIAIIPNSLIHKIPLNKNFESMIVDESHMFKNPSAKRTKVAMQISRRAKKRLIMTGTPILNSPMDAWSQIQIMDGCAGTVFDKNFFVFRAQYFYNANANSSRNWPDWKVQEAKMPSFRNKIAQKSYFAKKEDCLDLPPFVQVQIPVELSKEQSRAYLEMKKEFLTSIEGQDTPAIAKMAVTKILRLQQIISGHVTLADGDVATLESNRAQALQDLLESIQKKVIVWCNFAHDYKVIADVCVKANRSFHMLTGQQSANLKDQEINAWKASDSGVLIANPKSGGVGLNLAESDTMIYYNRSYSLGDDLQSQARAYRGGSEVHAKITRYDLYTPNTIDSIVLSALNKKQDGLEALLEAVSRRDDF